MIKSLIAQSLVSGSHFKGVQTNWSVSSAMCQLVERSENQKGRRAEGEKHQTLNI